MPVEAEMYLHPHKGTGRFQSKDERYPFSLDFVTEGKQKFIGYGYKHYINDGTISYKVLRNYRLKTFRSGLLSASGEDELAVFQCNHYSAKPLSYSVHDYVSGHTTDMTDYFVAKPNCRWQGFGPLLRYWTTYKPQPDSYGLFAARELRCTLRMINKRKRHTYKAQLSEQRIKVDPLYPVICFFALFEMAQKKLSMASD